MFSGASGLTKLGQPVPESYLSIDENNGSPDTISTYIPARFSLSYSFLNGGSVPAFCVTVYCSAVSFIMIAIFYRFGFTINFTLVITVAITRVNGDNYILRDIDKNSG